MFEYLIKEEGLSAEEQIKRDKISSIRIGKVTKFMYEKKPSELLPFSGKLPLVEPLNKDHFLQEVMKHHHFESCPDWIKKVTRKAEKICFLHKSFENFLYGKGIKIKDFKTKNPKIKQDILYDWLFSNKMDIGILDL